MLDKLINILLSFEKTTKEFSGKTYVILSKMMSNINELIFDIALLNITDNNDIDYYNEDIIFEEDIINIENDNEEIISNITKKKILIKDSLNTKEVLNKV